MSIRERLAVAKDIESAALQLQQDLKYPVDAHDRIIDMNQLPDVVVALVHHLVRCGWRMDESKRMIKARRVIGAGYYDDLITWIDIDEPDDPMVIEHTPQPEGWSVKPTVNMIEEPRPE